MNKKDFIKLSKSLEKKINNLSKQIKQCPEGKLICARNSKWIKWYISDGKTLTYLPKSERKLAEKLAKKEYLTEQLKECKSHAFPPPPSIPQNAQTPACQTRGGNNFPLYSTNLIQPSS